MSRIDDAYAQAVHVRDGLNKLLASLATGAEEVVRREKATAPPRTDVPILVPKAVLRGGPDDTDFLRIGRLVVDARKIICLGGAPHHPGSMLLSVEGQPDVLLDRAQADSLLEWLDARFGVTTIGPETTPVT